MIVLLVSILTLIPDQSSAQISIEGVTLPATFHTQSQKLILNGGGLREKLWFDLYVGGLYLQEKSSDDASIVSADQPMAMRLHIISSMITSEKMAEATLEGFEKSLDGSFGDLEKTIHQFVEVFKLEAIVEGDIFDLVYIPGKGVLTYKNDKLLETNTGMDFKKALFGIWLSDDPVDKKLKAGMLGK